MLLMAVLTLLLPLTGALPQTPGEAEQFTAAELYEQITVLETAGLLQLTAQQIAGYVPLLKQVSEGREQILAEADQGWGQYGVMIQQVVAAGIAGQPAPIEVSQNARLGITSFTQRRDGFYRYRQDAAARFMAYLDAEQHQLIEDAQAPQVRAEMARALEGATSVAEYIVLVIDAQRELMPDEYQLTRVAQAEQMAAKLVNPRSRDFANLVGRILELTDTIFRWSQEQYIQQYPGLVQQVSEYLQLPPAPAVRPISHESLLHFLSSPATVPLLQRIAALPEADPLPTGMRTLGGHPLAEAIEALDLLNLLNNLQLSRAQLAALLPVVQQIELLAQPLRNPLANQGEGFVEVLARTRDLMLATGQPSPEWAQVEAALEQDQREARLRIAGQLERVMGVLSPAQNDLIDWRPPADVWAADTGRMARAQLRLLAEIRTVVDMFERLRYRRTQPYQRTRIVELNGLLERYGIYQDSQSYPDYRSFGIDILDRMRLTKWEDWEQARISLALEFLRGVGVIEKLGGRPAAPRPVNWEDIYSALTNPNAAQIIQQMLAARSGI